MILTLKKEDTCVQLKLKTSEGNIEVYEKITFYLDSIILGRPSPIADCVLSMIFLSLTNRVLPCFPRK